MAKNNKSGSLKLSEKALLLLAEYQKTRFKKKVAEEYVFPELRGFESLTDPIALQNQIRYRLFNLDAALKAIGKQLEFKVKLTMHTQDTPLPLISG
ncbi:MAG: hypothetical protein SGI89_10020 [bacterium]|nr:hypothetical protein [bacterium]